MRKIVLVLGALALSVGMTASPAWSAEGGTERPAKGSFSFTTNVITGEGSGWALGAHTGLSSFEVQATSLSTGMVVLTAANGDQLFNTYSNSSQTAGMITYTGGTGRFEGATGEAQSTFVVTPTSDPNVVQVTGSIEGSISY